MIQETFHLILLLSTKEAAGPGLEPGTARSKVWCATIAPAGNRSNSTGTGEDFEETFSAKLFGKRREVCFFTNGIEGLATELDGLIEGGGAKGKVSHFSPRSGFRLAVKVKGGSGQSEEWSPIWFPLGPEIAQDIEHGGRGGGGDIAQGKTADGADLLFELAGGAGFGGEMAGVVDAGSKFIDPELAVGKFKQLDGEKADQIQFFGNLFGELSCPMGGRIGNSRGKESSFQDSSLMVIFKRKVGYGVASGIAGDDDGEFADKGNMFLEDGPGNPNFRPSLGGVGAGIERELSFAIVAKGGGFEARLA